MMPLTPLRRRMIEDLQVRNFAPSTQDNYIRSVARFARHFRCSPDRLGPEQIRAFQVHLVTQAKASFGVLAQYVNALRHAKNTPFGRWATQLPRSGFVHFWRSRTFGTGSIQYRVRNPCCDR